MAWAHAHACGVPCSRAGVRLLERDEKGCHAEAQADRHADALAQAAAVRHDAFCKRTLRCARVAAVDGAWVDAWMRVFGVHCYSFCRLRRRQACNRLTVGAGAFADRRIRLARFARRPFRQAGECRRSAYACPKRADEKWSTCNASNASQ